MKKLKILAISPDAYGVGKYRILDPYKFIGNFFDNEIHVDIVFDLPDEDRVFDTYDAVVFHTNIHKAPFERNIERIKWLKTNGIKVIMDIDDFWVTDHRHPMHEIITRSKVGDKKIQFLKSVDYVTTTTPIFANTIKQRLNLNNVFVFPNAIDENESQFKPNPIKSDRIRFGWLGGSSHLHDLELLESGIQLIQQNFLNKTQFVLCGFDTRGSVNEIDKTTGKVRKRSLRPEETIWVKFENIFTTSYKILNDDYKKFLLSFKNDNYPNTDQPYIRRWTEEISRYATNYNHIDVSLAPLVDTQFNSCKSQLKIIEAGFHKKAVIASDVKPYTLDLISAVNEGNFNSNGNALLVNPSKNHKDWAKHMKKIIENPNIIEDLGNRLYETVKDTYSLKKVSRDRVDFFKSIINK